MATFAQRLGMAEKVDRREMQLRAAEHASWQIENVVDDLHEAYGNRVGMESLSENRERIQRAHDKLTELLAKIGTKQMEAAE
jgi:hypothetical protein